MGAGAGYHAVRVLPDTGANKPKIATGKAANPEMWPFPAM